MINSTALPSSVEVWKRVPDWGSYEASNLGRVRSVTRRIVTKRGNVKKIHGKIRKPQRSAYGYDRVQIFQGGTRFYTGVHRLVALAWVTNPDPANYNIVNHDDGIKYNNVPSNLNWTDQEGNVAHARDTELRAFKLDHKDVVDIRSMNEQCTFIDVEEIVQLYIHKVGRRAILDVIKYRTWKKID